MTLSDVIEHELSLGCHVPELDAAAVLVVDHEINQAREIRAVISRSSSFESVAGCGVAISFQCLAGLKLASPCLILVTPSVSPRVCRAGLVGDPRRAPSPARSPTSE